MNTETTNEFVAPALAHAASSAHADALLSPARLEYLPNGTPVVLLPIGWKQESLAALLPKPAPEFRAGTVILSDPESLVSYVLRHETASSALYAERDDTTGGGLIVAVLDDGEPSLPARRVDRAEFKVHADPRFGAWLKINGTGQPQRAFMDFIEEHDREFTDPTGAKMRTFVNGLEVKKLARFKSVEREDSAARDVSIIYETSTLEEGETKFPQRFKLSVPIMRGTPPVTIEGRISFDVEGGRLSFLVKLCDVHTLMEAAWETILTGLRAACPTVPVFSGKPAPPA